MDIVRKAKVQIILKSPFFASLMLRRQFIEDSSIATACTNGKVIKYNPDYFESLSVAEVQGVIVHELMHITNLHHTRREGRDPKQWNEAADYAINHIIKQSGYSLPKGALLNKAYDNMSAEAIYAAIGKQNREQNQKQKEDKDGDASDNDGNQDGAGKPDSGGQNKPNKGGKPDPNGIGGVEDFPAIDQSQMAQAEAEAKVELAQALTVAKQQGKIPAGLQRLVEEVLQPKQNWKETLNRFVTEQSKNDYSWTRPNMRYLHSGFILPSLYSVEIGEIIMAVDTSGSIDVALLNKFAAEMQDIASTFNNKLTVIYCDAKVNGIQEIEADEPVNLKPMGGGGTDFIPPFKWIEKEGISPACVVYFTDGQCHSFPKEPDYPVLWAIYDGYKFMPPFGEVIHIDE